ncbi:MAG: 16S rRNA (cytosine(1402)-N(4))-methyltransferase [Piscirickettsiaceae bacterium]|nr:MAG: 16S rRNA (cytosine(1402)-N(4))-methyltransferase [Piscirickettsiaceae bacterium]PCI71016.1 MAG: 16S rRNA (cytosine(1402)-N(4))-methyltransferase [Piscirickettsiaceae bacterium]
MEHKPVLLDEAIDGLVQRTGGVFIDGTFGRGGHSGEILQRLSASGRLLAIDKDVDAMNSVKAKEFSLDSRFDLKHESFASMRDLAEQQGWLGRVDGILLDLGVSSPQLDVAERGFSFMKDGPLDMRMDVSRGESAAEWLSYVGETELVQVLRDYGEERFARKIAAKIISERTEAIIDTTSKLASIISEVVKSREPGKHPATRSFQAIRIKINNELGDLESALSQSLEILGAGGRLVVISFHSLEDRIVKRFMRKAAKGDVAPRKLPLPLDAKKPTIKLVSKALKASVAELKRNVRSRSAVLRIAEKL